MPTPSDNPMALPEKSDQLPLPVEFEIYVNPDGSVTFADLEGSAIPLARLLNPDQPLACDMPVSTPRSASGGEDDG